MAGAQNAAKPLFRGTMVDADNVDLSQSETKSAIELARGETTKGGSSAGPAGGEQRGCKQAIALTAEQQVGTRCTPLFFSVVACGRWTCERTGSGAFIRTLMSPTLYHAVPEKC